MESKATQQKPLSVRVLKAQGRQEAELTTIGLDVEYTTMEHVDLGLTSSLANVSTQLPTHHLEKCPTGTNGELDEAGILIETQTQEMSTVVIRLEIPLQSPPKTMGLISSCKCSPNTPGREFIVLLSPVVAKFTTLSICFLSFCPRKPVAKILQTLFPFPNLHPVPFKMSLRSK